MKKLLILILFLGFPTLIFCQDINKIDSLKQKLQQKQIDTTRISIHLKIGKLYRDSNPDSSLFHYNKALSLSEKINSEYQIAESLFGIAISNERIHNYEKAIENFTEAIYFFEKIKNKNKIALTNYHLGFNYRRLFAVDKAVEYFLKSLAIYREISDNEGIAKNLYVFGFIYFHQGNYEASKKYLKDAISIYKKNDNKLGIANCYKFLGNCVSDEGDFNSGFKYYQSALVLYKELDYQIGVSTTNSNIGYSYFKNKEYRKALNYYEKALEISKKLNIAELTSLVYLNIGEVQNKLRNYNKAIISSSKSLEFANKFRDFEYQAENLMNLSIAYEGLGNRSKANEYLKLCLSIKDTIIAKDKAHKIKLLHSLNQLDKNQFVIDDLSNKAQIAYLKSANDKKIRNVLILALLVFLVLIISLVAQRFAKRKAYNLLSLKNEQINSMNEEIWEQRENLKHLNSTKDKLFSIIAHDLKNPFNSIIGFTDFMIENNSEYDEEKRLKFLNIIRKSATSASDLLNNLLNWANFQRGKLIFMPQQMELKNEVSNVISLLEIQAMNKNIKILNNVESNILIKADLNMLHTVLRNLISNAIKFTKPGGKIEINALIKSNFVEITVKDNGIGIDKEALKNLFTVDDKTINIGTANERGSGLGLILCKDFVEKNGGAIWAKSTIGKGSEFKFTVPKWKE